ncbi:single-stranded DNA-binding protein [Gordonia bronchialis]|uniref:single-stranded DNA-binding protein n=1 Tax=Gordonia bronchialis TaxID=2054 RepID=UPI001CC06EF4|nr:single-stranded DNA-binding protein [Gordonia bronchialis]UAK38348.1 single-stranded DNA-binding protein [Gordonia bronchialis]
MKDTPVTIVGHLGEDPTLRFTASGTAVANVTIGTTPSRFNKDTSEWEDQTTLWIRGSVWRNQAENVAQSLEKGMEVMATGFLVQRNWTDNDGQTRYNVELDIQTIGPSLRFASAKVSKNEKPGQSNGTPPPDGWESRSKSKAKSDPYSDVPPPAGPSDDPDAPPF